MLYGIPKGQDIWSEVIGGKTHVYLTDIFDNMDEEKRSYYLNTSKEIEDLNQKPEITLDYLLEAKGEDLNLYTTCFTMKWYARYVLIVGEGIVKYEGKNAYSSFPNFLRR